MSVTFTFPKLKTVAAILAVTSFPLHSLAETPVAPALPEPPANSDQKTEDTPSMEDSLRNLFNGLITEVTPKLEGLSRDMGSAMQLMAPAFGDLAKLMDDIEHYDAPERLENGDILIRRKTGAPPPPAIGEDLKRFMPPLEDHYKHEKHREILPEIDQAPQPQIEI